MHYSGSQPGTNPFMNPISNRLRKMTAKTVGSPRPQSLVQKLNCILVFSNEKESTERIPEILQDHKAGISIPSSSWQFHHPAGYYSPGI